MVSTPWIRASVRRNQGAGSGWRTDVVASRLRHAQPMFGNRLQRLHEPQTALASLSLVLLFVGLDMTILNKCPLADQLGARGLGPPVGRTCRGARDLDVDSDGGDRSRCGPPAHADSELSPPAVGPARSAEWRGWSALACARVRVGKLR